MDKAVSIDLNTNIEVGEEHIIVPGDLSTFQKKNTEKYLGLLSNMKSKSGNGWMTTTNKEITLVSDNGTTAVISINGKQYSIPSHRKLQSVTPIEPTISGDIKSVQILSDQSYAYIIKDKIGQWWFCRYRLDGTVVSERVVSFNSTDEVFMLYNSDCYAISNNTYTYIYHADGVQQGTITNPNFNGYIASKPANNGVWWSSSDWAIGRDDDDSYYAWAQSAVGGGIHTYYFMGCINELGVITGEPVPIYGRTGLDVDYQFPMRLPNGILKWTRIANSDSDLLGYMADYDYTLWDFETIGDYKALQASRGNVSYTYPTPLTETGLNSYVTQIRRDGINTINRTGWTQGSPTMYTHWVTTDPSSTPGVWWTQSVTQYDNVFPYKYLFTNKQSNRGRTFDYGKGWTRTFSLSGGLVQWLSDEMNLFDPVQFECFFIEILNGAERTMPLNGDTNGNSQIYGTGYGLPCQTAHPDDSTRFLDSTMFWGNMRRHPLSSAQYNNKAWSQWYYNIGGTNFDVNGLVSSVPMNLYMGITNGSISQIVYDGYVVGVAVDNVLINTPSKELEYWTYRDFGNWIGIVTPENVYIIDSTGATPFKVHKIADFVFATNCITEWNTLQESRKGVVQLIRAFNPYAMAMVPNSQFRQLSLKAPADGSGPNDIWLTGAGVNVNLDDKYLATSFLLPAVQIPLYIAGSDLPTFNREIIQANRPLLLPDTAVLFGDEELDVYYTHTQDSSDITYKYTVKGSDTYFNSTKEDNSWWIGSTTVFFPVSIASQFSGINYMSSTVDLDGNYTARLYVNNNQAYLIFNLAEQVYYGSTIFTIYTNNYYYDGEAIYSIVTGTNEFVCYAIGLKFLGNSGTEAYFYSPYDKCIYLFSGSNTLSKARSLAKMGTITDSMFSSVNQRMYILDNSSRVLWLDNKSSGLYQLSNIDHLESSEQGAIFVGNNNWTIYSPKEEDYNSIVPLELETSWIGDNTSLQKFGYATVQLYSSEPRACNIEIGMLVKDGADVKQTTKKVSIKKSDWKGTYLRIRATPDYPNGQAFKFILKSNDYIHIMNIEFAFQQISATPSPSVNEITV